MREVRAVPRGAIPEHYVKVIAYDALAGPPDDGADASSSTARRDEPGFRLERQEVADRQIATRSAYATDVRPASATGRG